MDALTNFWNEHSIVVIELSYKIVLAIFFIFLAIIISRLARGFIRKCNEKYENFDATLVPVLNTMATMLIFTIFLVMLMDLLGINTASLVALLGAAGLAIGLGFKRHFE